MGRQTYNNAYNHIMTADAACFINPDLFSQVYQVFISMRLVKGVLTAVDMPAQEKKRDQLGLKLFMMPSS